MRSRTFEKVSPSFRAACPKPAKREVQSSCCQRLAATTTTKVLSSNVCSAGCKAFAKGLRVGNRPLGHGTIMYRRGEVGQVARALRILDGLLGYRQGSSLSERATEVDVSERTVRRDLADLIDAGSDRSDPDWEPRGSSG